MSVEFQGFPKIARLFRDVVITEKIDGTNAAVGITPMTDFSGHPEMTPVCPGDGQIYGVYAQSRSRVITPAADNFGFARWVSDNAQTLVEDLGEGLHFGEWWGSGIQRGYDLPKGERLFSLFNVKRWEDHNFRTKGLDVVPVLYRGPFSTETVQDVMEDLRDMGSSAAPGFKNPEGIVVYHTAGNVMFKATLLNDQEPKSKVRQ